MNEKMKNDELSIEQILSSIRSSISNSDLSGDESNNNPDVIELTNIVDDDGNIKFYDKKQESTDLSANDSSALNLILKNSLSVSALNDIENLKIVLNELLNPVIERWLEENLEKVYKRLKEIDSSSRADKSRDES